MWRRSRNNKQVAGIFATCLICFVLRWSEQSRVAVLSVSADTVVAVHSPILKPFSASGFLDLHWLCDLLDGSDGCTASSSINCQSSQFWRVQVYTCHSMAACSNLHLCFVNILNKVICAHAAASAINMYNPKLLNQFSLKMKIASGYLITTRFCRRKTILFICTPLVSAVAQLVAEKCTLAYRGDRKKPSLSDQQNSN